MNKILWVIVVIIIAGGGYWLWTNEETSIMPTTQPSTQAGEIATGTPEEPQQPQGDGTSASQNLTLGTNSNAKLGTYLIASNGMTLYTYGKDTAGISTCTGACAQDWPPYTVPRGSTLNLQAGVSGTISTMIRADGTTQVTHNGMPLYFYSGDKTSDDTNGASVSADWKVAKP